MESAEDVIEPDTKDWTWVLREPCRACGYDAATVVGTDLPDRIRANAVAWTAVLTGRADARTRPTPSVWSPTEYGCHVRDVHRLFAERGRLMVESTDPQFGNWDQDVTAVAEGYAEQDPLVVSRELQAAATASADWFAGVRADEWHRPGTRSDGSVFTVESLGRYYLHDIEHHLYDVTGARRA